MSTSAPGDSGWRPPRPGVLLATGLLAASLLDRVGWARLAQWREDQATNLWLGFTRGPLDLPVGLVSSVGLPNPNGMPLLGVALSRLPGLCAVSWTLGAIQAALVVALCFSLSLGLVERVALSMVLLSSVLLRAASVEFWNQWLLTTLDLAFAVTVVRYLRRPTLAWLPAWTLLAVAAPAIYLAGVVNAVVFAGVAVLLLLVHPPGSTPVVRAAAIGGSVLVAGASAVVTWIPYAGAVGLAGVAAASDVALSTRLHGAGWAVLLSPSWWPFSWVGPGSFVILQSSPEVLSPLAGTARSWTETLLVVQYAVLLAAVAGAAWRWRALRTDSRVDGMGLARRQVAWIASIPSAAYVVAPLLGGPVLALGERMDMALQWFPLLLVVWFAGPAVLPLPPGAGRWLRGAGLAVALLLTGASLTLGRAVQDSYLGYRGPVLVPADVPLSDKVAVVDLIASDWRTRGGEASVPVDYDLGGGAWDWVPSFGRRLETWYPAPMTLGRAFDYEFLRRHGLSNAQEGAERAPPGGGRYVVSYLALPPPPTPGREARHVPVGRLRVTIVDR